MNDLQANSKGKSSWCKNEVRPNYSRHPTDLLRLSLWLTQLCALVFPLKKYLRPRAASRTSMSARAEKKLFIFSELSRDQSKQNRSPVNITSTWWIFAGTSGRDQNVFLRSPKRSLRLEGILGDPSKCAKNVWKKWIFRIIWYIIF